MSDGDRVYLQISDTILDLADYKNECVIVLQLLAYQRTVFN